MATEAIAAATITHSTKLPTASPVAMIAGDRAAMRRSQRGAVVGPLGLAASVLLALAVGWQLAVQLAAPRLANPNRTLSAEAGDRQIVGKVRDGRATDPALQPELLPDDEAATLQTVQLSIDNPSQGVSCLLYTSDAADE